MTRPKDMTTLADNENRATPLRISSSISIKDAVPFAELTARTYNEWRQMFGETSAIAGELRTLHTLLDPVRQEAPSILSGFEHDAYDLPNWDKLSKECHSVVKDLEKALNEKRSGKGHPRKRKGARESNQKLDHLRRTLNNRTTDLSRFLTELRDNSSRHVEQHRPEPLAKMRTIAEQTRARNASVESLLTMDEDDDKKVWHDFRRDLISSGFQSADIHMYATELKTCLGRLKGNERLDGKVTESYKPSVPAVTETNSEYPDTSHVRPMSLQEEPPQSHSRTISGSGDRLGLAVPPNNIRGEEVIMTPKSFTNYKNYQKPWVENGSDIDDQSLVEGITDLMSDPQNNEDPPENVVQRSTSELVSTKEEREVHPFGTPEDGISDEIGRSSKIPSVHTSSVDVNTRRPWISNDKDQEPADMISQGGLRKTQLPMSARKRDILNAATKGSSTSNGKLSVPSQTTVYENVSRDESNSRSFHPSPEYRRNFRAPRKEHPKPRMYPNSSPFSRGDKQSHSAGGATAENGPNIRRQTTSVDTSTSYSPPDDISISASHKSSKSYVRSRKKQGEPRHSRSPRGKKPSEECPPRTASSTEGSEIPLSDSSYETKRQGGCDYNPLRSKADSKRRGFREPKLWSKTGLYGSHAPYQRDGYSSFDGRTSSSFDHASQAKANYGTQAGSHSSPSTQQGQSSARSQRYDPNPPPWPGVPPAKPSRRSPLSGEHAPSYRDEHTSRSVPKPSTSLKTSSKQQKVPRERELLCIEWEKLPAYLLHPIREIPTLPEGWDWRIDDQNRLFYVDTYARGTEKRCFWHPPKREVQLAGKPGWNRVCTIFGRVFWMHHASGMISYDHPRLNKQIMHSDEGELFLRLPNGTFQHWRSAKREAYQFSDRDVACQIEDSAWDDGLSAAAIAVRGQLWWGNPEVNEYNLKLESYVSRLSDPPIIEV